MTRNVPYLSAALVLAAATATAAAAPAMKITSQAFVNEAFIPTKYTCASVNVSPALSWDGAPAATKSFALIVEDPDAPNGIWTHWVAYNIPAAAHGLHENMPATAQLPDGTLQGKTSFGKPGYSGPCPPQGKGAHRYFFRLYALDTTFDNLKEASADNTVLQRAMKGHVIAQAELMGRYEH